MDELQLGPRAKRLAGLISDQSISDAVQRSVEAARKVRARAWNDTKAFFGWNLRILIWPGLYLLGFLGLIRYKGLEFAMDEMISYIFLSLIPVGIGVLLIFAYNFVRAPIRLVGEQRGRIADLERQVRPPEDRREAIRARLEVAI